MRDNTFAGPTGGSRPVDHRVLALLALVIVVGGYLVWSSRGPDLTRDQAAAARVAERQLLDYDRGDLAAMCSRMLEWDTKVTSALRATAEAHGGIEANAVRDRGLGIQLTGSAAERCVQFHSVSRFWAIKQGEMFHPSRRPQQASPFVNQRTVLTYGYGGGSVVLTMRRVQGRWMQERPAVFMPD